MDRERLLLAMGEVDDEVLYFKYHLKNVAWAMVMGVVTVLLCLLVAERYLGINGQVTHVGYDAQGNPVWWHIKSHVEIGRRFRDICLVLIPVLFYRLVRWRYTWVNFFVYFFLYFPVKEFAGQWPAMGYLSEGSGILAMPWILNPLLMMCHFWLVQSAVFAVMNFVRFLWRKWKGLDKMPPVC